MEKILVWFQNSSGFPLLIHNLKYHHIISELKSEHQTQFGTIQEGVPQSHFSTEHLPKYLLPKIVAVTAAELSGPGEFNY